VREEAQEKRPDRKVYSITPKGQSAFVGALLKPLPEDKHRSPFVFAMLFSHLLPQAHVTAMLDAYIGQVEGKLGQLEEKSPEPHTTGESFVAGFGQAVYVAILNFLRTHRAGIENAAVKAAAE
jgi:hypothetical protein